VILDLSNDEDALLQAMHKKHRYNIRLADRHGISVRDLGAAGLDDWYEIYRETARRDRIAIHSRDYYATLFDLAAGDSALSMSLYMAEHESEILAGIIVARFGAGATYLYGASSNRKREMMPNYALQWHAIRMARSQGCLWYDMFGIAPPGEPNHPMTGLTRIKTGFGGRIVERAGSWDYPMSAVRYALFRGAERVRDVYFHRVRRAGRGG
jgi:lipid II:glycine glycyltransferase (peptidoglycan interpeptide bridge formation enzyme)